MPSCQFDGNDLLDRASVAIESLYAANLTDAEMLVVQSDTSSSVAATTFRLDVPSSGNRLLLHATWNDAVIYADFKNDSTGRLSVAQPSGWLNSAHVISAGRQSGNMQIVVDRTQLASRNNASGTVTTGTATMEIGGFSGIGTHVGHIAEVVVWALAMPVVVRMRYHNSRQRRYRIAG